MAIETSGANWYRFKDLPQAAAALLTLGIEIPGDYTRGHIIAGDSGYSAIPWGEVTQETGATDGEGLPIRETLTGHFVLVYGADRAVIDQWGPWAYRFADDKPWPVEPSGWREQIEVCQELATVTDVDPIDATPVPAKRVLTEAQQARRDAIAAAQAPVLEQLALVIRMRGTRDGMNHEIQERLPAKRTETLGRIAADVALRAQTVVARDAQVASAQDDGRPSDERQAAREGRDRLNAEIDIIDARLVADRVWRDGYDALIEAQRAARDALVIELAAEFATLQARRATRNAEVAAIRAAP